MDITFLMMQNIFMEKMDHQIILYLNRYRIILNYFLYIKKDSIILGKSHRERLHCITLTAEAEYSYHKWKEILLKSP